MPFFNHLLQSKRRVKCTELVHVHRIYIAETESKIELMLIFKTGWSFLSGNGSRPWSYARNYSRLLKNLIALLLLSPDVSFWLYVISPEEFHAVFHGMGQYLSRSCYTQTGHVPAGSSSAVGLKKALRMFRLLSHSHRLSTFLCVVLSDQLSIGDKALIRLFFLTVEATFLRKVSSSSTEGTTAKLRHPWQVKLLVGSV